MDDFYRRMAERFQIKFEAKIETHYNIFLCCVISERSDGEPFTPEQAAWISGYEDGYQDGGFK